ncbi:MAG: hypothetical protein ABI643_01395 [Candidatus Doudnabacteria bacterium]
MSDKNKYLWIVGGLVVVALAIWLIASNSNNTSGPSNTYTPQTPTTQTPPTTTPSTAPGAASAAYTAALTKYAATRIQIQNNCQVVPNRSVYKTGTAIMLDNRTNVTRTVKLDSTFVIPAFGFKITTLSGGTLPRTILVDCDKSQNVATITLEK